LSVSASLLAAAIFSWISVDDMLKEDEKDLEE